MASLVLRQSWAIEKSQKKDPQPFPTAGQLLPLTNSTTQLTLYYNLNKRNNHYDYW